MRGYEKIKHGMDNVFGIEEPETYGCYIQLFVIGHGEMEIHLARKDSQKNLLLRHVTYFSGPIRWRGANFRTAPRRTYMKLMEALFSLEYAKIETRDYNSFLYLVDFPKAQIKILADAAEIIDVPPFVNRAVDEDKLLERIMLQDKKLFVPLDLAQTKVKFPHSHYVTVDDVLAHLQTGKTQQDILHIYPWLDSEDIQACLIYARRAISKPSNT